MRAAMGKVWRGVYVALVLVGCFFVVRDLAGWLG